MAAQSAAPVVGDRRASTLSVSQWGIADPRTKWCSSPLIPRVSFTTTNSSRPRSAAG